MRNVVLSQKVANKNIICNNDQLASRNLFILSSTIKKKKIQHKYNLSSAGHNKGRSSSTDLGNHLDQPSRWQMSGGGVRGVDIRGDPQG